MRRFIVLLGTAAALAACGRSPNNEVQNNAAVNSNASEKPQPAYCFFKDSATKGWAARADSSGNVMVTGKGYAEDPRYKAVLAPATVKGTSAEIAPTLAQNDTGFASPDNWWALTQTIANSRAVTAVTVKCGDETIAILKVLRKK